MITAEAFAAGCALLAAEWERWMPGSHPWRWEAATGPFTASLGGGYLAMRLVPRCAAAQAFEPSREAPNFLLHTASTPADNSESATGSPHIAAAEPPDEEGGGPCPAAQAHFYTFHVVYSPSFGVPVMHFEAQEQGGSPLGLNQVVSDLASESYDFEALNAMISQEGHPFLRRPFFVLHPCQTDEIMRIVTDAAGEAATEGGQNQPESTAASGHAVSPLLYMMAWLSVAGKVFDLQLPLGAWKEYWCAPK